MRRNTKNIMNNIGVKVRLLSAMTLAVMLTACGGSSDNSEKTQVKYETQVMRPEARVYNLYIPASLHGVTEVEVHPRVSGIIREVNFKDGIKVKKGQTLFVIDQTEHKLKVQNAQANLSAAKAQMETTRLQYETNRKLAEKKVVSEYVISTSRNAYHVAQASVQQAEAQLAMEQTNLGYCTVTSPINGIIKENGFKIGEVAELTDLLCTISDNTEIQAWFSYTESQLLDLLDRYNLKPSSEGLLDDMSQFESIIVRASEKGEVLRLSDLAEVELGAKAYDFRTNISGNPGCDVLCEAGSGSQCHQGERRDKESAGRFARSADIHAGSSESPGGSALGPDYGSGEPL